MKLPPLNFDSALEMCLAVERAQTLAEMGIQALRWVRAHATCSVHGTFELTLEESVASVVNRIECVLGHPNVIHLSPIDFTEPANPPPA